MNGKATNGAASSPTEMEEVIVKFQIKRKLDGKWHEFFGELRLRPETETTFDAEVIRCAAIQTLLNQYNQMPDDELILTFEKP